VVLLQTEIEYSPFIRPQETPGRSGFLLPGKISETSIRPSSVAFSPWQKLRTKINLPHPKVHLR
jgi:hypothetical protein